MKAQDALIQALRGRQVPGEKPDGKIITSLIERIKKLTASVVTPPPDAGGMTDAFVLANQKPEAVEITQAHYAFLSPPQATDELGRLGAIGC